MRQNMETYDDNINLLQSSETKWYQNRYIIISIIILGFCVLLGIFYRVYLNFFQKEGLQDINDISNVDIPVVDMTEVPTSSDASNTYDVDTVNEEEEITTPEPDTYDVDTVNEEEEISTPEQEPKRPSVDYLYISEEGNWVIPEKKRFGKKIPGPHFQQTDPASVDFNVWKTYEKCTKSDRSYPKYPCRLQQKYEVDHKGHRVCNPQGSKNCIDFVDGSINCNPEPSQTLYYDSFMLNPCTVEGPVNQYKGIIHLLPRTFQPLIPKR